MHNKKATTAMRFGEKFMHAEFVLLLINSISTRVGDDDDDHYKLVRTYKMRLTFQFISFCINLVVQTMCDESID